MCIATAVLSTSFTSLEAVRKSLWIGFSHEVYPWALHEGKACFRLAMFRTCARLAQRWCKRLKLFKWQRRREAYVQTTKSMVLISAGPELPLDRTQHLNVPSL